MAAVLGCSWEHECWPPATAGSPLALAAHGDPADPTGLLRTGAGGSRASHSPKGSHPGGPFEDGPPHAGRRFCKRGRSHSSRREAAAGKRTSVRPPLFSRTAGLLPLGSFVL